MTTIFEKMKNPYTGEIYSPYIGKDGIYCPVMINSNPICIYYQNIMPKDMFVQAYNKWINGDQND